MRREKFDCKSLWAPQLKKREKKIKTLKIEVCPYRASAIIE